MIIKIGISVAIIIIFTVIQIALSGRGLWWQGVILPCIYELFSAKQIVASLTVTAVRLKPDYYQAAVLFFPGVWLLLIYFIFLFYLKCRRADK